MRSEEVCSVRRESLLRTPQPLTRPPPPAIATTPCYSHYTHLSRRQGPATATTPKLQPCTPQATEMPQAPPRATAPAPPCNSHTPAPPPMLQRYPRPIPMLQPRPSATTLQIFLSTLFSMSSTTPMLQPPHATASPQPHPQATASPQHHPHATASPQHHPHATASPQLHPHATASPQLHLLDGRAQLDLRLCSVQLLSHSYQRTQYLGGGGAYEGTRVMSHGSPNNPRYVFLFFLIAESGFRGTKTPIYLFCLFFNLKPKTPRAPSPGLTPHLASPLAWPHPWPDPSEW